MNVLTALNAGLPYLQAPEVTSAESAHPMASRLRATLEVKTNEVLDRALWYHTTDVTLPLNAHSNIETPAQCRTLYPLGVDDIIEPRGELLWNVTKSTAIFTEPLQARVVLDLPFEHLPEAAARVVLWSAAFSVYAAIFDAQDGTAAALRTHLLTAEAALEREQLRKVRYSSLNSAAGQRILSALRGL